GLATVEWRAVERDPFTSGVLGVPSDEPGNPDALFLDLTDEQAAVLDELLPCLAPRGEGDAVGNSGEAGFRTALLQGVTGSGKTQVYLRLARACLDAKRTVL